MMSPKTQNYQDTRFRQIAVSKETAPDITFKLKDRRDAGAILNRLLATAPSSSIRVSTPTRVIEI